VIHVKGGSRMPKVTAVVLAAIVMGLVVLSATQAARAEPAKNQIEAQATCSDGESYAFVLNAMGKAWKIEGSNSNLLVKSYTLTYYDPMSGELKGSDAYGGGEKIGQEGDLMTCQGEVTTVLEGLGLVRVVARFEAFLSPRGGR
jgi:hypothetical protein